MERSEYTQKVLNDKIKINEIIKMKLPRPIFHSIILYEWYTCPNCGVKLKNTHLFGMDSYECSCGYGYVFNNGYKIEELK